MSKLALLSESRKYYDARKNDEEFISKASKIQLRSKLKREKLKQMKEEELNKNKPLIEIEKTIEIIEPKKLGRPRKY